MKVVAAMRPIGSAEPLLTERELGVVAAALVNGDGTSVAAQAKPTVTRAFRDRILAGGGSLGEGLLRNPDATGATQPGSDLHATGDRRPHAQVGRDAQDAIARQVDDSAQMIRGGQVRRPASAEFLAVHERRLSPISSRAARH